MSWLSCTDYCYATYADGAARLAAADACDTHHCGSCDPRSTTSYCYDCTQVRCEKSSVDCESDPDCVRLDNCGAVCYNVTDDYGYCSDLCNKRYPKGLLHWNNWYDCQHILCPDQC